MQGEVRVQCFFSPAENDRIAALHAQCGGVHRHVWPRFINEEHDAERHADFLHGEPVRPHGRFAHLADGIGQFRDLPQAFGRGRDARFGEREAVDGGGVQPVSRCGRHILGVGGEDLGGTSMKRVRRREQPAVLLLSGSRDEFACRVPGAIREPAAQRVEFCGRSVHKVILRLATMRPIGHGVPCTTLTYVTPVP